jgi:hypothetical protein
MDAILAPFVAAHGSDAEATLGDLLATHATPLIRRVVVRRLGHANCDVDDVCSQVVMQLMLRLRQGVKDGDLGAIEVFDRYTAASAHHGCDHYLRRKYPLRWQLRNRIRYVLEHDSHWFVWQVTGETWLCGPVGWQARPPAMAPAVGDLAGVAPQRVRELLLRIFQLSDGPLELASVVELAATAWGVPMRRDEDGEGIEAVPDPRTPIDVDMALRERAERVWSEIRELPVRQRQALLLNLKDEGLSLFLATGTASLRGVAEALEMPVETLAGLWNDLPLSDIEVALRMGCTRQQVINLRMSARKRLSNRMAG